MLGSWRSMRALAVGAGLALAVAGCGVEADDGLEHDPDEVTGANAVARTLTMNGYVLVSPTASASAILAEVRRQTRTMFGPLKEKNIGLDDRELSNVDPSTFVRESVTVVDTANPAAPRRQMLRVRYRYSSRAVVPRESQYLRSIGTVMLFGDYAPNFSTLVDRCSTDHHAREYGADTFWYMFNPTTSRCQSDINAEVRNISEAQRNLANRTTEVSAIEAARRFLPVTATLAAIRAPSTPRYPEYDQLFGARDPNKTELNVYAFLGVIGDVEDNPADDGYREMFYVLRNVTRAFPTARWEASSPAVDLTDIRVNGARVPGATHAAIVDWALGGRAPAGVDGTALRRAILAVWKARQINLSIPFTVTSGGRSHPLTVRVHTYYGDEGSAWSQQARQRYVSAWRDADVFVYSGHSHLGSGPLDPSNYRMSDFPDRYQIMMINSCVSYNYYNRDFYPLHPGGSRKLEMVVNGIEAYSDNGHAVSNLITGLLDGRQRNYLEILRGMVANIPELGLDDYDPYRVVDGEQDNTYSPRSTPITLTVQR